MTVLVYGNVAFGIPKAWFAGVKGVEMSTRLRSAVEVALSAYILGKSSLCIHCIIEWV